MMQTYLMGAHATAFIFAVAIATAPFEVIRETTARNIIVAILVWPIVLPLAMLKAIEAKDD